ncbi:MAG: ABC transporter permease subunit [Bacteroidaceae bacterium]|nr:ABC transporter permease subunit [Bacteroidaceae bacterium]
MKFKILILLLAVLASCSGRNTMDGKREIKDYDDLVGYKIAVLNGSMQDIELSKRGDLNLMRLNSPSEILAALEAGNADFAIEDSTACIGANIKQRGIKVEFSKNLGEGGDVAFGFRKDLTELCSQFNSFLSEIKSNGVFAQIHSRWMTDSALYAKMPHFDTPVEGKPIKVGISNNFPIEFISGDGYAGLEIEIIERFACKIGRPVEIVCYDFNALSAALVSGKIDIISSFLFVTSERAEKMLFSDIYYTSRTACFGRDYTSEKIKRGFITTISDSFRSNLIVEDRWKLITGGFWETLVISFSSIVIGIILGIPLCLMRMSKKRMAWKSAKAFIDIMQGVPILVFIMVMFYIVFAQSRISARTVAIIAFSINFGAYVSEVFRSGITGVDKGQTEAGLAMGFSRTQTFFLFVAPQALKQMIPVLKTEILTLVKNTSVVGYIAIQDLAKASDIIRSRTFDAFFPLIIVSIIYFLLAWLLGKGLDRISKRIK